ncbi:2Fe-2S iron-sulfur cluster-binding protein [Pseudomonas sp. NPDC090202]|uniref:2Fe-2S iron-sulfur cluster-binding protein n=1 Tax=unclassified Pseudomonas TaxID=196821 RepID=UPI00380CAD50
MSIYQKASLAPAGNVAEQRFADADTWSLYGAQWNSAEQKTLRCCAVQDETHDVKSFFFQCADFAALSYEPGQFITVSPLIAGQSVSRCYTLSSSPTRPFSFSITVKRVPGGTVSNWLHDHLRPGDTLLASGPAGSFTPVAQPTRKLLYLSAGSGVTPLMSMTRAAVDLAADLDIVFVHSARTPADIVFRKELARMQGVSPRLQVLTVCEGRGEQPDWDQPIGRLSIELLQERVADFKEREVFTCGPQGYMTAVKSLLEQSGFDLRHYHQESFDIALLNEAPLIEAAPLGDQAEQLFSVTLARSGKTFSMPASQTVLAAAKKAGAIVPSSCSQGVCGTCKTTLLEGTVEMKHNGGIRPREIDKGLRLLCCSKPVSDLVLDL